MGNSKNKQIANILQKTAIIAGIIIGSLVFVFALLSGSENNEGGISSIIKNSPNAFPWLVFLGLIWFASRKELIGGSIILSLGLYMLYHFNVFSDPNIAPLIISALVISIGLLFVLSWSFMEE